MLQSQYIIAITSMIVREMILKWPIFIGVTAGMEKDHAVRTSLNTFVGSWLDYSRFNGCMKNDSWLG